MLVKNLAMSPRKPGHDSKDSGLRTSTPSHEESNSGRSTTPPAITHPTRQMSYGHHIYYA